jgi:hypothetical protein
VKLKELAASHSNVLSVPSIVGAVGISFTGMDGPVPAPAGAARTPNAQKAASAAHSTPQVRNLNAKALPKARRITNSGGSRRLEGLLQITRASFVRSSGAGF